MARILLAWASRYGQTGRIAARMQAVLENAGHEVTGVDLGGRPSGIDLTPFDACLVGCPIYVGRHLKAVSAFLNAHGAWLRSHPGGFFSVSLAASDTGGPGRDDARRVLESFLDQAGWKPEQVALFGGALPYRRYNVFIRALMKRIVGKAGGETDTSRNFEYTDWKAVDEFTLAFAEGLA